ncbi:MAG: hypothetical protein OQK78_06975 [Gammaproteobacteria bacterium]|nr:hypothetical protein [Gammaproteobacteria bacterium]
MALFKRKEKSSKVEEEKTRRSPKFQGLSIGKIVWAGFLLVAIVTLISGYSSYLLYVTQIEKSHKDQQQATAQRTAAIFSARLDQLNESIKMMMKQESISNALNSLSSNETSLPVALQERFSAQLPQLVRQVVVNANTQPDDEIAPPLSFACLELASQNRPMMELHRFGTSEQHLDIAYPISADKKLLLSFDPKLTHQWLTKIDSGDSYIELQQQIGSHKPLSFAQTGNIRLKGNRNVAIQTIPGTQFQVAVSTPVVMNLTQLERILFFANFGIALLFVAAIFWGTLVSVRVILKKDLATIFSLMKSSGVSLHHVLPIKLGELRKCAEDIKRHFGVEQESEQGDFQAAAITPPKLSETHIDVDVEPAEEQSSESTDETK